MNFHLRCDDVLILWLLMDFVAASWEVLASTFLHIASRVFRPKVSKLWIPTEVQAVRFGSALPKSCGSKVCLGLICMVCLKDAQAM